MDCFTRAHVTRPARNRQAYAPAPPPTHTWDPQQRRRMEDEGVQDGELVHRLPHDVLGGGGAGVDKLVLCTRHTSMQGGNFHCEGCWNIAQQGQLHKLNIAWQEKVEGWSLDTRKGTTPTPIAPTLPTPAVDAAD